MVLCNFWRKFHVSVMLESKVRANFRKLGVTKPLDGGSTDISVCNTIKSNFDGVFSPFAKFSDPK